MTFRIAVVTGTRAEYGLFHPLLTALEADDRFDVGLIVTGAHLAERYGYTVREIETDGHRIAARVVLWLDDDSDLGVARATGSAVSGLAEALATEEPDLVVVLGDRYEALAAAVAAMLLRIPVAHLHGGELTEGAVDDSIRHAITKMSALHFTAAEQYRRRVIQMGEEPERVFAVGALGVENALLTPRIDEETLSEELGFEFAHPTALVTFHPVTHAEDGGIEQVEALLGALDDHRELGVLFTMPNADAGNQAIAASIEAWVAENAHRARAFTSLGRVRYLSALAACDFVLGNSSSGIIEAPSFGRPSIDIGDRQAGRIRAVSVAHCEPTREAISSAIAHALTPAVRDAAATAENPYGDGHAAQRIVSALAAALAGSTLSTRKRFYDLGADDASGERG